MFSLALLKLPCGSTTRSLSRIFVASISVSTLAPEDLKDQDSHISYSTPDHLLSLRSASFLSLCTALFSITKFWVAICLIRDLKTLASNFGFMHGQYHLIQPNCCICILLLRLILPTRLTETVVPNWASTCVSDEKEEV